MTVILGRIGIRGRCVSYERGIVGVQEAKAVYMKSMDLCLVNVMYGVPSMD